LARAGRHLQAGVWQPGATRAQTLLLAARIASAVRCSHTWANPLNQSAVVQQQLFGGADKPTLTLRLVQDRFIVTGSAVPGVVAGAELLGVDGRDSAAIVAALLPLLRTDGGPHVHGEGKRRAQISHGPGGGATDRLYPLLFPPAAAGWRLSVRNLDAAEPRELLAAPTPAADRDRVIAGGRPQPDSESGWTLTIEEDVAVLTLPIFAFWNSSFDARAFQRSSFADIDRLGCPYLVVDIRRNEGGDEALGNALLSQLICPPLRGPHAAAGGLAEQFGGLPAGAQCQGQRRRLPRRPAHRRQPARPQRRAAGLADAAGNGCGRRYSAAGAFHRRRAARRRRVARPAPGRGLRRRGGRHRRRDGRRAAADHALAHGRARADRGAGIGRASGRGPACGVSAPLTLPARLALQVQVQVQVQARARARAQAQAPCPPPGAAPRPARPRQRARPHGRRTRLQPIR
jgi:hypothetical protein